MKKPLLFLVAAVVLTGISQAARKNALEKEMESYARDFFRAHPEAAGDKKPRDARETMIRDARNAKILQLTKADKKKLRKRQDMVGPGIFSTALNELKSLKSKTSEITYLIKYAEQENIKPNEKLLAYRLIQHTYEKAVAESTKARIKQLASVLAKYTSYKKAHQSKAPDSLNDLDLAEDYKQFTNSKGEKIDWIYIGHLGPILQITGSHIVLAEPEPHGEIRICGFDDGNVIPIKNDKVEKHINSVLKAMKDGTVGRDKIVANRSLAGVMEKIKSYKGQNDGKLPESLDKLNLPENSKQYTDPVNGKKLDWLYLGKQSRISVGDGVTVIIVAPRSHQGKRLVGLSNGKVARIKDSEIAPMLDK